MTSTAQAAAESRAGRLSLIGGAPCLDFANTASGRGGDRAIEHLRDYGHLLAWSVHAGLLTARAAHGLRRAAARDPAAARRALARAKRLRDAIFALGTAIAHGHAPPAAGLAALNRALAALVARRRLAPAGRGFAWQWAGKPDDLDRPLLPIALSGIELLLNLDRGRLKQCPGRHCGWLFLDKTRSGTRRWCEMRICGSRAKLRRFRRRQRRRVGSPAQT
jgi:predicted RNA-binding Zn ribbon-like protein